MEEKFKCLTDEFCAVDEGDIITIIDGVAIDSEGTVLQVDLDCVKDKTYFHKMIAGAKKTATKKKKKKVEKVTEIIEREEEEEVKDEPIIISGDVAIGDYLIVPEIFDSAKTLDIAKSIAGSMLETVPKVYIAKLTNCARSETTVFWD